MFLFVVLGLLVYADETQEQQVERLIKLLQGQNGDVRRNAATALIRIGTPEALKAVKEYESQQ